MIKKYKKKPLVIEAVLFDGTEKNQNFIEKWLGEKAYDWEGHWGDDDIHTFFYTHFYIKTLEGDHIVRKGEYIIKGVAGEFYPCKPEIFKKTYEEV